MNIEDRLARMGAFGMDPPSPYTVLVDGIERDVGGQRTCADERVIDRSRFPARRSPETGKALTEHAFARTFVRCDPDDFGFCLGTIQLFEIRHDQSPF